MRDSGTRGWLLEMKPSLFRSILLQTHHHIMLEDIGAFPRALFYIVIIGVFMAVHVYINKALPARSSRKKR